MHEVKQTPEVRDTEAVMRDLLRSVPDDSIVVDTPDNGLRVTGPALPTEPEVKSAHMRRMIESGESDDERHARERYQAFLGRDLVACLQNDRTQNISINADGAAFVQEFGDKPVLDNHGRPRAIARFNMPREKRKALISYLANLQHGGAVDELHSELAMDLPIYGARVQCLAPPIADWIITIRCHSTFGFALEEYLAKGEMSQHHYDVLMDAIEREVNIGIGGAVNSGKTQLMRAVLRAKARFHAGKRGILIQDRMEIRLEDFPNMVEMLVDVPQAYSDGKGTHTRWQYGFGQGLRTAMRLSQNFLVIGEVRDMTAANALTEAANTGTRGSVFTIHCKSAARMGRRIEQLYEKEGKVANRDDIAEALELALWMNYDPKTGRRWLDNMVSYDGVDEDLGRFMMTPIPRDPDQAA